MGLAMSDEDDLDGIVRELGTLSAVARDADLLRLAHLIETAKSAAVLARLQHEMASAADTARK